MADVSLSLAVVGGALATLNPCSFPLLPAFLSFYAGADEERLPRASTRVAQGLAAGVLVTAGCVGSFAIVGVPISLGATALARALPWLGLAIGVALALAGALAITGRPLRLPTQAFSRAPRARGAAAMLLFGAGYGVASLGCTLPFFLLLLGSSLSSRDVGETLVVFAAFGVGMAMVLTALAVSAALLREGLSTRMRALLPYVGKLAGALLVVCGLYVAYYWGRVRFGSSATLADDPIVEPVTKFTAELQSHAAGGGRVVLVGAVAVVALAAVAAIRQRPRRGTPPRETVIGP